MSSSGFKSLLREARLEKGYTQAELAKRSGLEVSAISHFETGRREPSHKNFVKLVMALDIFADKLI